MPEYHGYGGLPWHHAMWGGPGPSLEMVLPVLVVLLFFLVLAAATAAIRSGGARWREHHATRRTGVSTAEGQPRPVLASDAEREEATRRISHAVGEGRLDLEEAERRVEAVLRSRHRHELYELIGDVPPLGGSSQDGRRGVVSRRLVLVAATAMLVAAAIVQTVTGVWELWPLAAAALGLWAGRELGAGRARNAR
jgi:hypothetical protein